MRSPVVICEVWSAPVVADASPPSDPDEARRWERLRRQDDRDRRSAGQRLLRRAAAEALGTAPERVEVRRRCPGCGSPEHGPPEVEGLSVSVSHGGASVLVALTRGPAVGVDVEELPAGGPPAVAALALGPEERAEHAADPTARDLLTRWVRKEAVLKATRQGLRVPMGLLRVSAPDRAAALLTWEGPTRPPEAAHVTLLDVGLDADADPDAGGAPGAADARAVERVACVAVLGPGPVELVRRR